MSGNKVVGAGEVRATKLSRARGDMSQVACTFPRPVETVGRVASIEGELERVAGKGWPNVKVDLASKGFSMLSVEAHCAPRVCGAKVAEGTPRGGGGALADC